MAKKSISKKSINKNIAGRVKERNERAVAFIFHAPEARRVSLAGEFNNWDIQSNPMIKGNGEDWETTIHLLPRHYEYKYFVDGEWIEDLPDVEKTSNRFGTQNFIVHVK